MSKILIAGIGPRPQSGQTHVFAPGLRLSSMAGELIRTGHDVHVAEAPFSNQNIVPSKPEGAAALTVFPPDSNSWQKHLDETILGFKPDAVIALTDAMALAAATTSFDGPLYVDYFGHPMAERQMLAAVHNNNSSLVDQWLYVLPVLLRADRFSVCSSAQRHALIGELGAAGRLGAETCGVEMVDINKPALPFDEPFPFLNDGFLRGNHVSNDARIMLFTGGYNTWLDEKTLFEAVEQVLEKDRNAVYVSTGGEIEGHVSQVFRSFRERVDHSQHRERYKFVGWLEHEQYVACCLEADVGVYTDRPTLEGEFGCRNRVYGWLWGGMRAVAPRWSEMVEKDFEPAGLVRGVALEDADGLAAALLDELQRGRCGDEEAIRQRELLREVSAPSVSYRPLIKWARNPERVPDRVSSRYPQNQLVDAQRSFLTLMETESAARELAERLQGSRAFQMYAKMHPEVTELLRRILK